MKLDKKQLPQAIILGVLIVLVLGFGLTRLMGTHTDAATPAAQSVSGAENAPAEAAAQDSVIPQEARAVIAPSGPKRDPFTPVSLKSAPFVPGREPTRADMMVQNAMPLMPGRGGTPLQPLMPIGPGKGGNLGALMESIFSGRRPGMEAGKPAPSFQLTGVVGRGDRLAVLRGSGEERYFVRQGDRVGGQYQVASITSHAVILQGSGGKVTIKLGDDGKDGGRMN